MNAGGPPGPGSFDAHAASYDDDLARGLSLAGEDKAYYAGARMRWVARRLAARRVGSPALALDFGCGDGASAPLLGEVLRAGSVVGVDVSEALLAVARERHGAQGIRFLALTDFPPDGRVDLAFTNGVFHHIPPAERGEALEFVRASLRPGGLFAFWENNPWNPGTRAVMHRIPFDRDAVMITPFEARRLLRSAGFKVLSLDSLFYFPHLLRWLRPLEPALARLPLGGQYFVLAQRP
ncbi:MAG: class I SAM-dependent methyltransferase [Gemmatimonadales bacterium]